MGIDPQQTEALVGVQPLQHALPHPHGSRVVATDDDETGAPGDDRYDVAGTAPHQVGEGGRSFQAGAWPQDILPLQLDGPWVHGVGLGGPALDQYRCEAASRVVGAEPGGDAQGH